MASHNITILLANEMHVLETAILKYYEASQSRVQLTTVSMRWNWEA